MKTFTVTAKERFDKVNGNSYFGLQIKELQDNHFGIIHESFCNYGYGDHYMDVAKSALFTLGKLKRLQEYKYGGYEYEPAIFDFSKYEVKRKKDMKF